MQLVFETIYISQQVQYILRHLVNVAGLGTMSFSAASTRYPPTQNNVAGLGTMSFSAASTRYHPGLN